MPLPDCAPKDQRCKTSDVARTDTSYGKRCEKSKKEKSASEEKLEGEESKEQSESKEKGC
jgi:hypothetical protein